MLPQWFVVSFRMVVSQLHSTRDQQAVPTFLAYSILRNLLYLTLEPSEYSFSSSQEYKEPLHLVSHNEEKLLSTMTQEQKELFSRYSDCVWEFQSLTECSCTVRKQATENKR